MKVRSGTEWAIIAATLVMLLLLLILFTFSHPHSDDYSYNRILEQKGFYNGSLYLFRNNTGRFFSTAVIFLSPLQVHSVQGYQYLTLSLFIFFILSLFLLLYFLLRKFLPAFQILALSAFVLLAFFSFAPNLHEFCYWLSGAATYLVAATLWLWAILLHTCLLQQRFERNILIRLLSLLNAAAITGCSESGIFLYSLLLGIVWLYRRQYTRDNRFFYIITICFTGLVFIVFTAAGSMHRFGQTPFAGNFLLAAGGGLYTSCFWLGQWIIFLIPAVLLYLLVWGNSLSAWSAAIGSFRLFRSNYVLTAGLSFFVLCQVAAVWMSGSMPEQRFENVMFLFILLLCLFTAQLFFHEQKAFFSRLSTIPGHRLRIVALLYFTALFSAIPNNYNKAVLDIFTGRASHFHQEQQLRAAFLNRTSGDIVAVVPVIHQPSLLYYPALSCNSRIDQDDIPRLALANYFGKKWIYEYPCSPKAPEYSLKDILKQKRRDLFSEKEK